MKSPRNIAAIGKAIALLCLLGSLGATLFLATAGERLEDKAGALPTSPELERWLASAREVERGLRKGETRFTLEIKKAHVYAKVLKSGEIIGRMRPETTATSVRGEVSTFNIGRALGCGELFQPGVEIELRGKGLAAFRRQLEATTMPEHKRDERAALLQAIEDDPEMLRAVYKPVVPADAMKYRAAERPEEPPNGGLETTDVIVKYLRHDAPQPGPEMVALPEVKMRGSAVVLARQLSNIFLVDALAGQWDRFSGHNLHIIPTANGAQFMAIDNGGADPTKDQGYIDRFTHWVTRFDPVTVEHLLALDAFLRKRGRFRDFASEKALEGALGFDDAQEWKAFKERVHRLTKHVQANKSGALFER